MKTFYRSSDPATRKNYVTLVEDVQHKGGEVVIFSSMHESGQREYYIALPVQLVHAMDQNSTS